MSAPEASKPLMVDQQPFTDGAHTLIVSDWFDVRNVTVIRYCPAVTVLDVGTNELSLSQHRDSIRLEARKV